jgi:hypothetical protein
VLRLEAIAAGLWPTRAEPATDRSRVVLALRAMLAPGAGDAAPSVISSTYESLLSRRGALLDGGIPGAGVVLGPGGSGEAGDRGAMRLSLLRSLAAHCSIVLQEDLSSTLATQVCSTCTAQLFPEERGVPSLHRTPSTVCYHLDSPISLACSIIMHASSCCCCYYCCYYCCCTAPLVHPTHVLTPFPHPSLSSSLRHTHNTHTHSRTMATPAASLVGRSRQQHWPTWPSDALLRLVAWVATAQPRARRWARSLTVCVRRWLLVAVLLGDY